MRITHTHTYIYIYTQTHIMFNEVINIPDRRQFDILGDFESMNHDLDI